MYGRDPLGRTPYGRPIIVASGGGGATFIPAWANNSNLSIWEKGTSMYRKNTAGQFACFQMLLTATGAVATGLSPTVRRCIDGTFAAGGGTITEDGATGSYKYAMTQADTNGNDISFIFTAAGAMPVCVNIVTTAADPTDVVRFGLTALPNAAAQAAGGLFTRGTGAGQIDQEANGYISVNLKSILGTVLTETAGQIAAGFKKVFDVAAPVFTAASVNQTGDNFARIGAPVGASISADVAAVKGVLPTSLVSGRIDASVGAMAANVLTATAIAADAITDAKVAPDVTIASVTGAVGSVTGNVGGNVVGTIGNLAAAAKTDVENSVWNTVLTSHLTAGSTGNALNAAGSAGDPWATALPGAYGAGTAGNIIGNRIDAAITSRLAAASYTTPPTVALIRAEMDSNSTKLDVATSTRLATAGYTAPSNSTIAAIDARLPPDPADASDITASFGVVAGSLTTVNNNVLAVPNANANADALLDRAAGIETGWTMRQGFRIMLSVLAGKANGLGTATANYRDMADSKNRIVATVDTDGNRSAITRDAA